VWAGIFSPDGTKKTPNPQKTMRIKHVILAGAFLCAALPTQALFAQEKKRAAAGAVNYNELYKSAVADYKANRNLEAETKFRKVLNKYPDHIQSRRYRSLISNRMRELAAIPVMKKRLSEITIEEISFQEATLAEVMEFVTRKAKELSSGKVTPGLVIRGGDPVRDRPITIQTGKVPLSTLIDTAAKLTNTRVEYKLHALTFTPLPTGAELSAMAEKKLKEAEAKEHARAALEAERNDPFRNR
jgi:hypothetical protein